MRNRRPTISFMVVAGRPSIRKPIPTRGTIQSLVFASEHARRLRARGPLLPADCKRTNGTDMGGVAVGEGEFEPHRGCSSSAASANVCGTRQTVDGHRGIVCTVADGRAGVRGRVRADAVPGAPDTRQGAELHACTARRAGGGTPIDDRVS